MSEFSKKYNIKINNTDNIIDILSNVEEIKFINKYNISELYFANNSINLNDIYKFEDIYNYAVIVKQNDKKEIRLYDEKTYTASLTDILTASELMLFFDYKVLFLINKSIYEFKNKNFNFYIQYVNDKDYYLTFDKGIKEEFVNQIIGLFKDKLNVELDDKLYLDILQNEFDLLKK